MFSNSTIYIFCVVASMVFGFVGWLFIRFSERRSGNDIDHTPYFEFEDEKKPGYTRDSEFSDE